MMGNDLSYHMHIALFSKVEGQIQPKNFDKQKKTFLKSWKFPVKVGVGQLPDNSIFEMWK